VPWGRIFSWAKPMQDIGRIRVVRYEGTYSGVPNPCSVPFILKIGWVSPDPALNKETRLSPEIPSCVMGMKTEYTSGIENYRKWWHSKITGYIMGTSMDEREEGGYGWINPFQIGYAVRGKMLLGRWTVPSFAEGIGSFPGFWMRKLAVENITAQPDPFSPGGGRMLNIRANVAGLPDYSWLPQTSNWTLEIRNSSGSPVYSTSGTGYNIDVNWDGIVGGAASGGAK